MKHITLMTMLLSLTSIASGAQLPTLLETQQLANHTQQEERAAASRSGFLRAADTAQQQLLQDQIAADAEEQALAGLQVQPAANQAAIVTQKGLVAAAHRAVSNKYRAAQQALAAAQIALPLPQQGKVAHVHGLFTTLGQQLQQQHWSDLDRIRITYMQTANTASQRASFNSRENNLRDRLNDYLNQICTYRGAAIDFTTMGMSSLTAVASIITAVGTFYTDMEQDVRYLTRSAAVITATLSTIAVLNQLYGHCRTNNIRSIHQQWANMFQNITVKSYFVDLLTYSMVLWDQDGHTAINDLETQLLAAQGNFTALGAGLFQ